MSAIGTPESAAATLGGSGSVNAHLRLIQTLIGQTGITLAGSIKAVSDASSTVTSGGVSQLALAANSDRKFLKLQNVSSTLDLWYNVGSAAAQQQGSIKLGPGVADTYENQVIPSGAVHVIGPSTGQGFTLKHG
jgi:hypothetical protein